MKSFGLDKNYEQINFDEVTVEELQIISGGTGGGGGSYAYAARAGIAGAFTGAVAGALRGASIGVFTGPGIIPMIVGNAALGALVGFTGGALASTYG